MPKWGKDNPPPKSPGRPRGDFPFCDDLKYILAQPSDWVPGPDATHSKIMAWRMINDPRTMAKVAEMVDSHCRKEEGTSLEVEAGGVTVVFKTVGGPATEADETH